MKLTFVIDIDRVDGPAKTADAVAEEIEALADALGGQIEELDDLFVDSGAVEDSQYVVRAVHYVPEAELIQRYSRQTIPVAAP